jgi:hypothetical protein
VEDAGLFYGHFVYFTDILSILWTFSLFYGHFGLFYDNLIYVMALWCML